MGNRAVITTPDNFKNNGVGIYLHWNGGRDSVEAFLDYAKKKGYRDPSSDTEYGLARLTQVIANFLGGTTSIGIGSVRHLDTDNGDNGTYLIGKDWKIVGRKFAPAKEQHEHDLNEMVGAIDERQPKKEQFGKSFLNAKKKKISDLKVGDYIFYEDWNGDVSKQKIVGIGKPGQYVNGTNVEGIPFINQFEDKSDDEASTNPNNYLTREHGFAEEVKIAPKPRKKGEKADSSSDRPLTKAELNKMVKSVAGQLAKDIFKSVRAKDAKSAEEHKAAYGLLLELCGYLGVDKTLATNSFNSSMDKSVNSIKAPKLGYKMPTQSQLNHGFRR